MNVDTGCVSVRVSHAHDSTRVKSAKETSPILRGFGKSMPKCLLEHCGVE